MANTLRFKRGLASGLPTGLAGEPLFTTDTFDLYIGNGTGNTRFQKFIASGTTSQLLRGDGSLLTMPIVLSSPANGEVLKYNGTNWVNSSDAGITGSGVAGQVAYFTGATTQGGSNNLFWDASNSRLGIGTNAPTSRLYVTSPSANTTFDSGTATDARIEFRRAGTRIGYLNWDSGVVTLQADSGNYLGLNAGGSERARIFAGGNVAIGSTTDNGLRFQVTGDGYFSGSVGIGTSTPLYKLDVLADTSVEPVTTPVDNYAARFRRTYTNNNASVGARRWNTYIDTTYNGNQAFTNASGLFSYVNYSNTNSSSTVNGIATYVEPTSTSAASVIRNNIAQLGLGGTITNAIGYYGYLISLTTGTTTNVKLFQADALGSTNTITNLYGFIAESTLTNATNNYGFYGNIPSGTGRWNLYMNGTAANYLNGNTGIRNTAPARGLEVGSDGTNWISGTFTGSGGTEKVVIGNLSALATIGSHNSALSGWTNLQVSGAQLIFSISGTERMRLDASGNLLVGTTTALYSAAGRGVVNINGTSTAILSLNINANTNTGGYLYYDGTTINLLNSTSGGSLLFSTANTERARIDASGNLGLGVTPSAWNNTFRVMQLGATGSVYGRSSGIEQAGMYSNAFFSSATNDSRYIINGSATNYIQSSGIHYWFNAPSGTAGNAITFTQAMTLDASGNLLLGSTSSSGERLQVTGTAKITDSATFTKAYSNTSDLGVIVSATIPGINLRTVSTGRTSFIQSYNSNGTSSILVGTGSNNPTTTVMTFNGNDGTVNVGSWVASTGELLQVQGTAKITGASTFGGLMTISGSATTLLQITSTGSAAYIGMGDSSGSLTYIGSDDGTFLVQTPGSSYSTKFSINSAGAATFSSSVTAGARYIVSAASSAGISDISYGSLSGGAWINTPSSTNGYLAVAGNAALRWSASELNFYVSAAEAMRLDANGFGIGGVPAQKLDVQGSANSIQARFGNVAGRGLTIGTSAISGTNDAGVVFNAPTATDGTLIFQTTSVERARISGSGNLLINTTSDTGYKLRVNGTSYFDDNLRFPNLKGCVFVQTGGSLLGSIAMDSANAVTIDNNGFAGLSVGGSYTMTGGNLGIGHSAFGTSATKTISVNSGTAPSTSPSDAFQLYSADITAGNAAPHFRTENGGIIKLYQQTTGVTSATYIGGAGTTVTDLDTFDGYTIPQIVKALRNAGLLA